MKFPITTALLGALSLGVLASSDVTPPISRNATFDTPATTKDRVVVEVWGDGTLAAGDERLWRPETSRKTEALQAFLTEQAQAMPRSNPAEGSDANRSLPDGRLLIRAEGVAPFSSVLLLMQQCAQPAASIWRIELAAERFSERSLSGEPRLKPAFYDCSLPLDLDPSQPVEKIEIRLRILREGSRESRATHRPWTGPADGAWIFANDRKVEYAIGPFKTHVRRQITAKVKQLREHIPSRAIVIDTGPKVAVEDMMKVLDSLRDAGVTEGYQFVGRFD